MTTLYIYDASNYQDHINNGATLDAPIAQYNGNVNDECEQQACNDNYDDADLFAWSYTNHAL